ncbi:MAG: DMT family transporter [Acutalibacteraceae bacterium]|nr:DMT family transporter [Clostridia bacterium]MEE3403320.1 DMT family transporter [Acutalibacteraceae bacterium]HCA56304.1 EamA family transporter [Oscillospiraceae bacterium]
MRRINSQYRAIIYIILSAFCFAVMNLFVRMSGDIPPFQKSFFRNLVAVVFAAVVLVKQKSGFRWNKGNLKYLLLRSGIGTIGIVCNFYALSHIPLSDASILNKMSPFFVIIFSFFILKERLTFLQGAAVVIAFVGSLFVIKPSFQNVDVIPSAIGLFGGMCAGFAYTMVRILGNRKENGSRIVFFFSTFSCLSMLPFLIFDYHPMAWWQILMLLGAGLAATGGQFSITAAYCHAPAREISVYDYSQIIFATLLGVLFLGEVPDIYSFIGYIIIVAMAVLMFLYNNHKPPFRRL